MGRYLLIALVALLVTGCSQAREKYYWGGYEDQIYVAWVMPGKLPPEQQVEGLERDYQAARATNQRMPPGWHAHLGSLYYQLGRSDQARQELLTEKSEYPESAVFVDRLLLNLTGS